MRQAIEAYLAVRRTSGFELKNDEYLLHSYARFAAERGEPHVHTATAITWAAQSPSVAQREARLKTLCRFARFVRLEDEILAQPSPEGEEHRGSVGENELEFLGERLAQAIPDIGPGNHGR